MNRAWAAEAVLAPVLFALCTIVVRIGISEGSRESVWIVRPFGEWPDEVTEVRNSSDIQFSIFATFEAVTPQAGPDEAAEVPALFGRPTVGSVIDSFDSENINGSRYVTGLVAGPLVSVSVFVAAPVDDAPNDRFQVAIYDDEDGAPGRLLATTEPGPLVADAWNTLPISADLLPRTPYWLMYNSNGTNAAVNNPTYTPVVGNPLDHVIRSHRSASLIDRVEQAMSLANMIPMTIAVAVLAVIAGRRRLVAGLALAIGFAAAMLVAWFVREAFFEPYGRYPSGHALRITYVAVALAFVVPRRSVQVAGAVVALLVCVGAVYTYGHYSEEVVAGVLLGWAFARGATAVAAGPDRSTVTTSPTPGF